MPNVRTGPLYCKYNVVLRVKGADMAGKEPVKFFVDQCRRLCKDNVYTTTLHVINSALVK